MASYGDLLRIYPVTEGQGIKTVFDVRVSDLSRFTRVFDGSPLPCGPIRCDGNRMTFQARSRHVELIHHIA